MLASLGLQTGTPSTPTHNHAATYLILHFFLAYVVLSARALKMHHNLDHQVSPRYDVATYGEAAVKSGKITKAQLDRIKRVEAAHANSTEHYPVFAAAILLATIAGVRGEVVNRIGLAYTGIRVVYAGLYLGATTYKWAILRGPMWWAGNGVCVWLLWQAGKELNRGL